MLVYLLAAGCSSTPSMPAGQAQLPTSIECLVFYRVLAPEMSSQELTIKLTEDRDREVVTFDDLEFNAQYWHDDYEGRSLTISVTARDTAQELVRQLYQIDSEQGLSNQFVGGHGFTGLSYIYHPTSAAEMQYFCNAGYD